MIDNIIKLLDDYPLEWDFGERSSHIGEHHILLIHEKTGITIKLFYRWSRDTQPESVSLHHCGKPTLGWWEHRRLYKAVRRIQRRRYDALAENHIKSNRPRCYTCKKKLQCPKCDNKQAVGTKVT